VACKTRNVTTLKRIAFLGAAFSLWLVPAAHTIVATAGGRMAWDRYTVPQNVFSTFTGVAVVVHSPWLWMFLAASWFALARHLFRSPQQALPAWLTRLFFLCSLILLYLGLAGFIVAKAGMAHFRFYVFAVPLFAIAAATLLAQLRRRWAIAVAALLISATALPAQNAKRLIADEDWRSMTQAAVRGADEHTVFLFPFIPNRDHYRIYLEKYLQQDSRPRMVGVSNKEDISSVCERLSSARHVAVMGYASSRQIIDDVYAACGRNWPARERREFINTFAEHWRAVSGGSANPPPGLGSLYR
jgi:signal transduction histidine kinase